MATSQERKEKLRKGKELNEPFEYFDPDTCEMKTLVRALKPGYGNGLCTHDCFFRKFVKSANSSIDPKLSTIKATPACQGVACFSRLLAQNGSTYYKEISSVKVKQEE